MRRRRKRERPSRLDAWMYVHFRVRVGYYIFHFPLIPFASTSTTGSNVHFSSKLFTVQILSWFTITFGFSLCDTIAQISHAIELCCRERNEEQTLTLKKDTYTSSLFCLWVGSCTLTLTTPAMSLSCSNFFAVSNSPHWSSGIEKMCTSSSTPSWPRCVIPGTCSVSDDGFLK